MLVIDTSTKKLEKTIKMLCLARVLAFVAILSIWSTLPLAARCDTSYYEKYYSARRFLPPKRSSLVPYNFTVTLSRNEPLVGFERIALVGDVKQLGAWKPHKAILLNRTLEHNVFEGSVELPANSSINYRYFIAAVSQDNKQVQIRHWESSIQARQFTLTTQTGQRADTFGWISAQQHEVQRGWLNSGNIVQFKLFRNPLNFEEKISPKDQIRIKLEPVEAHSLTKIVSSARAHTEYVRMEYGNSFLRAQPEFGVPYRAQDILIFHIMLGDLQQLAYRLKVYASAENSEAVRLIAYQHIHAESLSGSEGNLTLQLLSPIWLNTIGSLQLQYLNIHAMPNSPVDFRSTFVDYWRTNWTQLDVGHRGLGKSFKQTTNAPPITENTVASMKASADLGTEMVEFDVQLTSDLVPIISHDYSVWVCMDPKTPTSKNDLTEVLIKDITYEQLKNLKTYQVVGNRIVEYAAHNSVEDEDYRLYPSFEDFLTKIDKSVGFDIEIKWPQLKSNGLWEATQTIDKNLYIDRILDVMYRHGCGRLSFFTSFDADICSLLRFKQNMYPVMFLSSSKQANFADPRSDTIYDSVNNAQAFDLAGIVPNAIFIQSDPSLMQIAYKQQKKVFLWGDALKDTASINWFKQQQPNGVIYDRLDLWLPEGKQNAFLLEADLPQFFQTQCPVKQHVVRNATIDSILSNVNML